MQKKCTKLRWFFGARIYKGRIDGGSYHTNCKLNKNLQESSISVGIHRQKVCIP